LSSRPVTFYYDRYWSGRVWSSVPVRHQLVGHSRPHSQVGHDAEPAPRRRSGARNLQTSRNPSRLNTHILRYLSPCTRVAKILDLIFVAFNFGLPFDRHFRFFAEVSVDALERAAAGDAEYKFADGSSSPGNTIIVGVGVGPDASLRRSIRFALRFTPRVPAWVTALAFNRHAAPVRLLLRDRLLRLGQVLDVGQAQEARARIANRHRLRSAVGRVPRDVPRPVDLLEEAKASDPREARPEAGRQPRSGRNCPRSCRPC
jgi:hypothetical protein